VIGIMPRGFYFPDPDGKLFVPLALTPQQTWQRTTAIR